LNDQASEAQGGVGLLRTRSRNATIEAVAARAGVSRQTVSNVLNAPERVSPQTAERVRRAIAELGYRPNWIARRLRNRASRVLGFRIEAAGRPGLGNLIDRFLHALTSHAENAGYRLLLFTHSELDDELATYEELIATGTVDGFVLCDLRVDDHRPAWLVDRGVPFACFGRPWGQEVRCAWVDVDGALGTAQAVDHMVRRGHRRIAYLGWHPGTGYGDDRAQGWRQAMHRHGLATDDLQGQTDDDVDAGADIARQLLAVENPPTAFVCASDTLAVGVRLATRTGPEIDVVGFDDSPVASLLLPPLSSVRQPLEDVARAIVRLLVEQLDRNTQAAEGVLLPPQLVVRE
jgi:DNA-binding LacI/PurR family transcriptional regulator